ncbi:hypothetical protein EV198_2640 [Roseivirga ehrenbergii]|uniref:Uncharacterized protein n=1 Tax=Roseivirga ehrenbergii (strain DSM 102268 / JCM 13514 / KCTC 12282 / NCIMB 14502 / KMM 6017) TaxID=279360 RepID=A0A150XTG4_ROSEK|nr:hypothetical protein [Roseivirga ehrenbergii]KYG82030.1 hypothetical protein MB14_01145 [Roseivirga ehrenbergii]TCL01851.1 hypothetical protein EV198_2640 [Roseivirga ehrenbergii]
MINASQTQQIRSYLLQQGFTNPELIDDLVDHLSCEIELLIEDEQMDFATAFSNAKEKVMPDYAIQIENDLKFLTTKKYNTMIKKLAFIGGYASAVCLCFAILFFSQSLLGSKGSEFKMQAIQAEYYSANPDGTISPYGLEQQMNTIRLENAVESSLKFDLAETFLIISFILFASLYLPYQFYSKYQRSEESLQQA